MVERIGEATDNAPRHALGSGDKLTRAKFRETAFGFSDGPQLPTSAAHSGNPDWRHPSGNRQRRTGYSLRSRNRGLTLRESPDGASQEVGRPTGGSQEPTRQPDASDQSMVIRTFLIADVRGYTLFTQEPYLTHLSQRTAPCSLRNAATRRPRNSRRGSPRSLGTGSRPAGDRS